MFDHPAFPLAMAISIQFLHHLSYTVPVNPAMMITNASQWILRRLRSLVRPFDASAGLGAFALPPEIILMITSQLSGSSSTSLALTCRALYSLCFPENPLLDMAEKEHLLLLLEKDVPTHYFCHFCVTLHRWHIGRRRRMHPWYEGRMHCKRGVDSYVRLPATFSFPYYHARLIMNRHFYGPKHGPHLHSVEVRAQPWYYPDGVAGHRSQRARIVDDQLLVLSVTSIFHSRGDSIALRRRIDSFGPPVCTHLSLSNECPNSSPMQLPELARDKTVPGQFSPCNQVFRSCSFCLTDYSIDISWQGERKGYVIDVTIHCQPGDCRSPFDWRWHTITTRCTKEDLRRERPLEYRPGCVRDRWNKADGISRETHGEWVEISGLVAERRLWDLMY